MMEISRWTSLEDIRGSIRENLALGGVRKGYNEQHEQRHFKDQEEENLIVSIASTLPLTPMLSSWRNIRDCSTVSWWRIGCGGNAVRVLVDKGDGEATSLRGCLVSRQRCVGQWR